MSITKPAQITLAPITVEQIDAANWRPVTLANAVEILATLAMTIDEPTALGARADQLPDARIRVIYYGYVKPLDFNGEGDVIGPYLMLLHDEEGRKQVWLERQDVNLAVA